VVVDTKDTVDYYPARIALEAKVEVLQELDERSRSSLEDRLSRRRHGPWKILRKRLRDLRSGESSV
jgi:hypothetical protein